MAKLISNKNPLSVVLDEPVLYLEDTLGSVMVRGEVIGHFTKDTAIQGPIELVFEGIQRYNPWPEIMRNRPLGDPIETTLQVTELSLLPPNSQGIIPAGIHRFPFEFPIPASLPTTVSIPERLEIFYRLTATIRRSQSSEHQWIDWALRPVHKKKLTAAAHIRLIHAVPSAIMNNNNTTDDHYYLLQHDPWNLRSLTAPGHHRLSLDEQYDRLANALVGRTSDNLDHSNLEKTQGIRYRLHVDRTAIALGTRVGIDVMIEPTLSRAKIRSIKLLIAETREYSMKIPGDHGLEGETRRANEAAHMILKWAYGSSPTKSTTTTTTSSSSSLNPAKSYVYHGRANDPCRYSSLCKRNLNFDTGDGKDEEEEEEEDAIARGPLVNLKELDQTVDVGDYFDGRFIMPVPKCSNVLLHPSMESDAVKIHHWLRLSVIVECNDQPLEITLEAPMRMLDCRLVADDERQTILPPPPSYSPTHTTSTSPTAASCDYSFWEQRQPITMDTVWGSCHLCPCQVKAHAAKRSSTSPCTLHERGPPPSYSEQ
ncbi:hypothetical protein EC973_001414 [Apophysomyces ossiformis]|uniref:Arrestin C-terminal-like domain-containing protein n=1 Tax=Apophysomyces ossiformis TaxID=679940 RepID=A0A8H7BI02_9FUNG|nr:hypothetical protein EC973_001414 [Apophysomyces ossiformis]